MVLNWPILTDQGSHQLKLASQWVAVLGIVFFSGSFFPLFKLTEIVPVSLVSGFQKFATICFLMTSLFAVWYVNQIGRNFQQYKTYSFWAFVVFGVWITMSLTWTLAPSGRALYFGLLLSSTAFAFFLSLTFTFREVVRHVSVAFLIILVLSLLFEPVFRALLIQLKGALTPELNILLGKSGIFTNKNILARVMAFATLFWAFQCHVSVGWKRWFWLAMLGVAIYVVERAGSLTAVATVFSIAVTAVVLWILFSPWIQSKVPRALLLVSGFVICLVLLIEFSTYIADYSILEGRFRPWKVLVAGAQVKFAFGVGLGGFWHDQEGMWRTVDLGSRMMHSHNGFLDIWLELGAIGLFIFVSFGVILMFDLWLNPANFGAEYSFFFTLFLAGFFVYNLFESSILPVNSAATLLWILMVWLVLECDKRRRFVIQE